MHFRNTINNKDPNFFSSIHEEINGVEYMVVKMNSGDQKSLDRWKEDSVEFMHKLHRNGISSMISIIDLSDAKFKPDRRSIEVTLEMVGIAEDLGFKKLRTFVILPNGKFKEMLAVVMRSVSGIVDVFSQNRYDHKMEYVKNVNEGRKKIMKMTKA